MDYKNEIIKMLKELNDEKYLEYIYVLIQELLGIKK